MIKEKNGTTAFERVGRWNTVSYTIITRNNINARYAEDNGGDKLWLTYFKPHGVIMPIGRFEKLSETIVLEDRTKISHRDIEGEYYMEMNSAGDKVRLYKEVNNEN